MEFKLNEYNRNISDDDLLNDIKAVAKKLNKNYLSRQNYEKNGKYSATPFINRFGSWISVLEKAGLSTIRGKDDYKKITNEELILDIQNVVNILNKKTLTTGEYNKLGNYRIQTILKRFNNWNNALYEAKLEPTGYDKNITNEDLFLDIEKIWTKLGKQPTSNDVKNRLSNYSLNTFSRRFGGWRKALEAFVLYINSDNDDEKTLNNDEETTENISTKEIKKKIIKSRRTNREINLRYRFKVLQRDNFKCQYCGASPATDHSVILHVDHILPWSKGGETVLDNLQTLCSKCNLGKSDLI